MTLMKHSASKPMIETLSARPLPAPISIRARIGTLTVVIVPFAGMIAAIALLWGYGVGWMELGLLFSMYTLTVLGVTVGFHRLFTHHAFETYRIVQCIFAVLGSMAAQGSLLKWVAFHRRHHQYSDQDEDPHSPYFQGKGIRGVLRGAWYAHVGWFFDPDPSDLYRYVKDLRKSKMLSVISTLFPIWITLGLLIPALLGELLTGTWMGALLGFLWGGLARIFLVHHVTWSINSVCHLWGRRPFATNDHSKNNILFGILGFGEGWHNNHHAFPMSARHGFSWWQIDISYWVICLLAFFRLAWKIKLPSASIA